MVGRNSIRKTRGFHARGSWFDFLKLGGVEIGSIPEFSFAAPAARSVIARETKFRFGLMASSSPL
jgi:hypothetical protein